MKNYISLCFALFVCGCIYAQNIEFKNSIDTKQTELILKNIKSFPENTQFSIAIIKNNKVDFVGVKKINDTINFTKNYNKVFEIGSITKVFTATLLSNFVIDKKLKLDDNIQNHLSFKVNSDKEISFKQLANHTSGFPRLPANLNLFLVDQNNPYKDYSKEKLTEYLTSKISLLQNPGEKYAYSNLGAGILGFELAIISNSSYEELLQEKIFSKFNMTNATSKRANISSELIKGILPNGETASNWNFDALAGGGAIFSTVEDLSKFALAQFDANNKELKLTQQPTFKVNENMSIGLGWHILKRKNGGELVWHNGGTGGYTSSMALDLQNNNGIIILSNVSAFNSKMGNIDRLCFELINTL